MPKLTTPDGAGLYYRVQGKDSGALPLVMIHGWCSNSEHWANQARYFARQRRVLRMDRRGMGRSTTPGSGHTARQHADDIAGIMSRAGIKGAVAVGHAGGGPATMTLARDYPRLIKAAVIVDSAMYPKAIIGRSGNAFGMVLGTMIDALSARDAKRAFRRMYTGYFDRKCDRAVARAAIDDAMQTPLPVAVEELRAMAVDVEAIAEGIRQPVLWLTATAADQRYVAAHLARVQFGQVVGSGHFPQLEVPAQTNAMIETFLKQL